MSEVDHFYASKTTLNRLQRSFDGAYLEILNMIGNSPAFFAGHISGDELLDEFVQWPRQIKEEAQKAEKEKKRIHNEKIKKYKSLVCDKVSPNKCQAIIHLKKELRQCRNDPLPDEDLCLHHEKLDVLPYGRVELEDD